MNKKTVSASTLAETLGISTRRIGQLVDVGVLPRAARNEYPLAECRRAYQQYKQAATDSGDESTYLQYLKTSNDLMEKQNQVKRGELIHRDDFTLAISNRLQATRARLLVLPTKAAPLLVGNDDKGTLGILTRMVNEARRELEAPIDFLAIAKQALKDKRR